MEPYVLPLAFSLSFIGVSLLRSSWLFKIIWNIWNVTDILDGNITCNWPHINLSQRCYKDSLSLQVAEQPSKLTVEFWPMAVNQYFFSLPNRCLTLARVLSSGGWQFFFSLLTIRPLPSALVSIRIIYATVNNKSLLIDILIANE